MVQAVLELTMYPRLAQTYDAFASVSQEESLQTCAPRHGTLSFFKNFKVGLRKRVWNTSSLLIFLKKGSGKTVA